MSLEEAVVQRPPADQAALAATTEADIRRHMLEDGEDPDAAPGPWIVSVPAGEVRAKLGLTPGQMAELLQIPQATWEAWEWSVHPADPGVRQLLLVQYREPAAGRRAAVGAVILDGAADAEAREWRVSTQSGRSACRPTKLAERAVARFSSRQPLSILFLQRRGHPDRMEIL